MSPDEVQVLANMNVALWIIAILGIISFIGLIVTFYFMVKLMKRVMVLLDEVKVYTKTVTTRIDPLIDTAIVTFHELNATSKRLNAVANKIMDVTGSVSHFLNYFNIFKGLTPGGKNKGFMSGLLSGISIFSGLIKSSLQHFL